MSTYSAAASGGGAVSDIDLTEAVEAVAAYWADGSISRDHSKAMRIALPHIERQVREQVAREIAAFAADPAARLSGHSGISVRATRAFAARIAQGVQ